MSNRPIYLSPTYHPAAEKLMEILSEKFEIVYYNKDANQRMVPDTHNYDFVDLKLAKLTLKKLDFAFTNTLPVITYIFKRKPKFVVTEDYLFCLPYLIVCKLLRIKVIYFNSNTSPLSTRVRNKLVKLIKSVLLSGFDEYWHGFKGAENYITQYVTVESKLRPWFLMSKPLTQELAVQTKLDGMYVGEFSKRKRIDYALDLWRTSESLMSLDVCLTMVGCSRDSEHYQHAFRSRPYGEVLDLMSRKHFLFLLSEREAMGAVVLEALAHGLFVVLSKEIGAKSYVMEKKNLSCEQSGIIYYNSLGCIIDPEIISPVELLTWLKANKSLIQSNRAERSLIVNEHFV